MNDRPLHIVAVDATLANIARHAEAGLPPETTAPCLLLGAIGAAAEVIGPQATREILQRALEECHDDA